MLQDASIWIGFKLLGIGIGGRPVQKMAKNFWCLTWRDIEARQVYGQ
jgi:hypothetical protein